MQRVKNFEEHYYLPLLGGNCWRLRSADRKTDYLVDDLARICHMAASSPYETVRMLDCEVHSFDHLESFRTAHPDLYECGRKHYYRIFFDTAFLRADIFLNMEEVHNDTMKILFTTNIAQVLQLQLVFRGSFAPCHCALVEINGNGAAICAAGNTGKTTSARRIESAGHRALADDYALLNEEAGKITAQAMPSWSNLLCGNLDYTADCSESVVLSAVFFLIQSSADYIEPLSKFEAVNRLNRSLQDLLVVRSVTDMPLELKHKFRTGIFDFAHRVLEKIPAYNLHATLHGRFWDEMDEVMRGRGLRG